MFSFRHNGLLIFLSPARFSTSVIGVGAGSAVCVFMDASETGLADHETPSAGWYARVGLLLLCRPHCCGKRIQITKSRFESRKEVGQAFLLAIHQHRAGPATVSRLDFDTFISRWLEEHAKRRCTPKTVARYTQLSRYALRHPGNIDLHSLTPVSIESALSALRNSAGRKDEVHPLGRPLSARTVRHVAFLVHDSLEAAVRWGTQALAVKRKDSLGSDSAPPPPSTGKHLFR
jgi:hypothetical protein